MSVSATEGSFLISILESSSFLIILGFVDSLFDSNLVLLSTGAKFSSVTVSGLTSISIPIYIFILGKGNFIFFTIMFVLIFYTHRENIKRLINKEETKSKIY